MTNVAGAEGPAKRKRKPAKKKAFKDGQAPAVKKAKAKKAANRKRDEAMTGKDSNSVVNTERYQYEKVVVEGPDGKKRHTADNADRLAAALRETPLKDLLKIAKGHGIDVAKYSERNVGLQRMAIGNALRGVIRKGTTVEIGGKKIASL